MLGYLNLIWDQHNPIFLYFSYLRFLINFTVIQWIYWTNFVYRKPYVYKNTSNKRNGNNKIYKIKKFIPILMKCITVYPVRNIWSPIMSDSLRALVIFISIPVIPTTHNASVFTSLLNFLEIYHFTFLTFFFIKYITMQMYFYNMLKSIWINL